MTEEQLSLLKKQRGEHLGYSIIFCMAISALLLVVLEGIILFISQAILLSFTIFIDNKLDRDIRKLLLLNKIKPDSN